MSDLERQNFKSRQLRRAWLLSLVMVCAIMGVTIFSESWGQNAGRESAARRQLLLLEEQVRVVKQANEFLQKNIDADQLLAQAMPERTADDELLLTLDSVAKEYKASVWQVLALATSNNDEELIAHKSYQATFVGVSYENLPQFIEELANGRRLIKILHWTYFGEDQQLVVQFYTPILQYAP